jgi:thiamine-phosphate pyrophosphorylase
MHRHFNIKGIDRIIDANINRTKEGLRVCEEVARFILNSRRLTAEFKKIRHKIDGLFRRAYSGQDVIKQRQSLADVGRQIHAHELKRQGCGDIFLANIQRVKESLRVLEEFSKLKDSRIALEIKSVRYQVYELEKKAAQRLLRRQKAPLFRAG